MTYPSIDHRRGRSGRVRAGRAILLLPVLALLLALPATAAAAPAPDPASGPATDTAMPRRPDDAADQVDVRALIAAAPAAADLPRADAVDLLWRTTWHVDGDGRVTRREHVVRKLFTPWAVRNLSDRRVAFDSARQSLAVPVCRTFMNDGTVVTTPPRGINEITPDAVARAADFLDVRESVISHVGTEPGCVTELIFEVRDRTSPPLPAGAVLDLGGRHPVLNREVVVIAPGAVQHALLGAAGLGATAGVSIEDGVTRLRCTAVDVAAVPDEAGWLDRGDVLPRLVVATAADWSALVSRWRAAGAAALGDTTGLARWLHAADPQEETGGGDLPAALSPLAPVRRAAEVAGKRLETVAPPTGIWSRSPRPVARVLATGGGTAWEKSLVATALLESAGQAAEVVFFSPGASFAAEVPAAEQFVHARVVTPAAGENWWISTTGGEAQAGRYDLPGRTGILLEQPSLAPSGGHRLDIGQPTPVDVLVTAVLRPAGASGGGETLTSDELPWRVDLEYTASGGGWPAGDTPSSIAERLASTWLHGCEVDAVHEQEVVAGGGGRVRATLRGETPVSPIDAFYELPLAGGPASLADLLPAGFRAELAERRTPLHVERPLSWEVRLRVVLPDSLAADHVPSARRLEAAGTGFTCSSSLDEHGCEVRARLEVPAGPVSPSDYPAWREVMREPLLPRSQRLVLVHTR
ncbi:MAG: DUF3857 domain-containing protein [Candidatus Krumholzibacteriia bacterium]